MDSWKRKKKYIKQSSNNSNCSQKLYHYQCASRISQADKFLGTFMKAEISSLCVHYTSEISQSV